MPPQLRKYELPLHQVEAVRRGEVTLSEAVLEHLRDKLSVQALPAPWQDRRSARTRDREKGLVRGGGLHQQGVLPGAHDVQREDAAQPLLEITQRRNKIAHDADLIDGDLKQRRPIDEAEVTDVIDWIERIALASLMYSTTRHDGPGTAGAPPWPRRLGA